MKIKGVLHKIIEEMEAEDLTEPKIDWDLLERWFDEWSTEKKET